MRILYSATSLVNFIRKDCIIDYLDIIKRNNLILDNNFQIQNEIKIKNVSKKRKCSFNYIPQNNILNDNNGVKRRKSSFDYIVADGYKFEGNIFDIIKERMIANNDKLIEIKEDDFDRRYKQTVSVLLERKCNLILGALLINDENHTYGYPDMIVSGIWINKYINDSIINIADDNLSKYYIIDVKSSTINLISNGDHVSTGLLYDGYKLQIYVYMKALENIYKKAGINNNCDIGFILGKKYTFINNKEKIKILDPFERLAVIDYNHEELKNKNYQII